jgi:hypothetical protein
VYDLLYVTVAEAVAPLIKLPVRMIIPLESVEEAAKE